MRGSLPYYLPPSCVLSKPPVNCLVHSLFAFNPKIFATDHFNKVFSGHRQKVWLLKQALEVPVHKTIDFSFEICLLKFMCKTLKSQAVGSVKI